MTILGAALVLLGCDRSSELRPGVSTIADVNEKMGKPSAEWHEGEDRVLEYPFTPEGTRNYMVVVGPDGILKKVDQVLTDENFAKVRPGLTREQIRRLLGKPASIQVFQNRGEEVWDWKLPALPNVDSRFNVHFNLEGVVTATSKSEQSRG